MFKWKKKIYITILRKWALQRHPDFLKETQEVIQAAEEMARIFVSGEHSFKHWLNTNEEEICTYSFFLVNVFFPENSKKSPRLFCKQHFRWKHRIELSQFKKDIISIPTSYIQLCAVCIYFLYLPHFSRLLLGGPNAHPFSDEDKRPVGVRVDVWWMCGD